MALEIEADRSHGRDVQMREADAPGGASRGWPDYLRWLSFVVLIGSILTIMRSLPFGEAMTAVNGWLAGLGPWGPVALALLYIIATVLFVPGTILTLTAGALFGLVVGMVAVSVGSTLGAAAAFSPATWPATGWPRWPGGTDTSARSTGRLAKGDGRSSRC